MTDKEMMISLIHIKRHIYSKPIKRYIDNLLCEMKSKAMTSSFNSVQSDYKYATRLYQVTYDMPLYGQKKEV